MRILLVTHRFLPRHRAGTELYTAELARRLSAEGDEVHVATAEKDVSRPDLTWTSREFEGLPVHELTQNLLHEDFRETWDHPVVNERFDELLQRLQPDVVHAQHLLYLGVGVMERARAQGAATAMTCHDFWFECPRLGQLVHADGGVCESVDFQRCGSCLPSYPWSQPAGAAGAARLIAGVRRVTGVNLGGVAERWNRRVRGKRGVEDGPVTVPGPEETAAFAALAAERSEDLRERLSASVQRFFSPSRFLRDRLVRWGIPPERVEHVPTGVEHPAPLRGSPPENVASGPVEVLFLGSFVPLKGAHVLVDAWSRLGPGVRERARLRLHGPAEHAPGYARDLERRAAACGAELGAPLDRDGVATAIARADLLVVPSLWFENRPLVILEAFAAGKPVLVSDLGGSAELVEPGRTGWRFPAGDASALADLLSGLIDDPASIPRRVSPDPAELPDWSVPVARMRAAYEQLRGEVSPPA